VAWAGHELPVANGGYQAVHRGIAARKDDEMRQDSPKQEIDWIAVGREAHELELRHGRNAFAYAAKLAEEAKRAADPSASAFWHAVSASLAPRGAGGLR
jgi:hypothetical protein